MFAHGFTLGKFMPLHAGHLYLIETAARQCAQFTVLVCTLQREPIPGALRYAWAQAELAHLPNVTVVHVSDEVPATPAESADFWPIWVALFRRYLPAGIDVFFASEPYAADVARHLGIAGVCLDEARATVPVSASAIRAAPLAYWPYIPAAVRPYYTRRVALVGPESTGKSTLAVALAAAFHTVWVPEFARTYLTDQVPGTFTPADLARIGEGQQRLETAALPRAHRLLFCDTDALTTATWAALCFGPDHVPPALAHAALTDRYDLTLLLADDIPWTQDAAGSRAFAPQRAAHYTLFQQWLTAAGRPWHLLTGTGPARTARAVALVEQAFGVRAAAPT